MLGLLRKKNIDKISSGFAAALAIPFGKRIEKATSELINESATAYDQNIDTIAAAIRLHHSQPLEGVTIQSELPRIICRENFPEISNSGLQKRFCSTSIDTKSFDVHIQMIGPPT